MWQGTSGPWARGQTQHSILHAPLSHGEIAPGFAKAASAYVKKNPDLFPGISPDQLALGGNAPRGTFDGIQVTAAQPTAGSTPTSAIYYPGSPMETHYRGGFLIGVAMPINVFNLFKGNGK